MRKNCHYIHVVMHLAELQRLFLLLFHHNCLYGFYVHPDDYPDAHLDAHIYNLEISTFKKNIN